MDLYQYIEELPSSSRNYSVILKNEKLFILSPVPVLIIDPGAKNFGCVLVICSTLQSLLTKPTIETILNECLLIYAFSVTVAPDFKTFMTDQSVIINIIEKSSAQCVICESQLPSAILNNAESFYIRGACAAKNILFKASSICKGTTQLMFPTMTYNVKNKQARKKECCLLMFELLFKRKDILNLDKLRSFSIKKKQYEWSDCLVLLFTAICTWND